VLLVDDVLALQQRMGSRLLGVVINSVPEDGLEAVRSKFTPYLEGKGVRIYGALPQQQALMSLSVSEMAETLNARLLTGAATAEGLAENLTVGAMSVEAAMPYFRRTPLPSR
jgi:hypothetical protein